MKIDWWQFAAYVEGGRVVEDCANSELFVEWKVDGGLAIRNMMAGGVVRPDVGYCNEAVGGACFSNRFDLPLSSCTLLR